MIEGIPKASVLPATSSFFSKEEAPSFIEKIKKQKEERRLIGDSDSAASKNPERISPQNPTTPQIRYGEAPSAIERKADTGLNTSGLRNKELPTKPTPAQELNESRGGRRPDQLENSIAERNRQVGIITRYPRNPAEPSPQLNLQGTEHRSSKEFADAVSPSPYEALLKRYREPKEEESVGKKIDIQG